MKDSKICISAAEVSARIGISLSLVRQLTRSGAIPHIKVGRRIVYPLMGIEDWLKSHTIGIIPPSKASDTDG